MAESSSNLKLKEDVVSQSQHDEKDSKESKEDELAIALDKLKLNLVKKRKKKLLVLSLGGLFFHRVYRYNRDKIPKLRKPDTSYGSFLVYKRPFAEDFLNFCFEKFEVGIWSAARDWHVDNALNCVMGGLSQKLAFIWDHNQCTNSGLKCLENAHKPIYFKQLGKLWDNKGNSLPWPKGYYSAANTLMIDDEPYKSVLNPPNNAVFITEYHADDKDDTVLAPNSELRKYLIGVADSEDVPSYVNDNPFGLPINSSANLRHLKSLPVSVLSSLKDK